VTDAAKIVRWGILGCGDVAEVKSGPAFQKARHSKLVAVMRRDAGKARAFAERHGVPRWYSEAELLIADPEVDMVYVATPPSSHREHVLACARAAKPVYVEKPMARNYRECLDMIAGCRDAGVPLFVAYYRRALPKFLKVKEWIDSGAIGVLRYVTTRMERGPRPEDLNRDGLPWRVVPEISGGGYFHDLACHTLDLLDFFLGPVLRARGFAANLGGHYPAEDTVGCTLEFTGGVLGSGLWCFVSGVDGDRTDIVGSRGRISFSTFGDGPVTLFTSGGNEMFSVDPPTHIQQPMIQCIVDARLGYGTLPSTGETASRTSRVMDWILQDWRERSGPRPRNS